MEFATLPLLETGKLNTRLFLNCLEEVSDKMALQRPNAHTNNVAFIACHILDNRYHLSKAIGLTLEHPLANYAIFSDPNIHGINDVKDYPPVKQLCKAWQTVSVKLLEHLPTLTEEALHEPLNQLYPSEDKSVLASAAFLLQHEAYHIGQLALLRKYLGLKAMSYK
jgi:uncharacterized damage-inducible protein DinB